MNYIAFNLAANIPKRRLIYCHVHVNKTACRFLWLNSRKSSSNSTTANRSTAPQTTATRYVTTTPRPENTSPAEGKLINTVHNVNRNADTHNWSSPSVEKISHWNIDFTNTENGYKSKSFSDILRALLVFQLCTVNKFVDYNMQLASIGQKILRQRLFTYLMKNTFYGQFVAGENQEDITPVIRKMQDYGVGAILDYAVEEDISEEEAKDLEMNSCISDVDRSQTGTVHTKYRAHREFGDRRHKVVSARTYFYKDEEKCDQNMKIFLKCIDASASSSTNGFAAVKLTALGRPQFLLQFSEALIRAEELFNILSIKNVSHLEKGFDLDRFQKKAKSLGILMSRHDSKTWFTWMDQDDSGFVDLLDWNQLISSDRKFCEIFVAPNPQTGELESLMPHISDEEEAQMRRMLQRMDTLAQRAQSKGVRLMVDAEQTYFQPAISRFTLEMMRRFNKDKPVILNTYQCYLKKTFNAITLDLALAQRENFIFGCKLVRGAYMEQERERAAELAYEDPMQPTYEATTTNYLTSLDYLLDNLKTRGKINIMVASHNENTIKYALQRMHDLNISSESQQVFFGQLLGMCDHVTFPLGQAGHSVFKYVPFGPVREVLPYLSRRAQENRGMLAGAQKERELLWTELKRRARRKFSVEPRD